MNESVDLHNLDEGARALVQRLLSELKHKQALLDKLTYEMALLKRLKWGLLVFSAISDGTKS